MVDWDRIAELEAEVGADGIEEVIALFIDEVSETVDELSATCGASAMAEKLHFLKGSSQNIGLKEVSDLCLREEIALRSNPNHTVNIPAISDALGRAIAELGALAA